MRDDAGVVRAILVAPAVEFGALERSKDQGIRERPLGIGHRQTSVFRPTPLAGPVRFTPSRSPP
jgi:hypothetical protein